MLVLDSLLLGVTVSYLALGVASAHTAARLWWIYAIVVFVLVVADLYCDKKRRHRAGPTC